MFTLYLSICCCCLPCNHCSIWTGVVGRNFGLFGSRLRSTHCREFLYILIPCIRLTQYLTISNIIAVVVALTSKSCWMFNRVYFYNCLPVGVVVAVGACAEGPLGPQRGGAPVVVVVRETVHLYILNIRW